MSFKGIVLSRDTMNFLTCIESSDDLALVSPEGLWGTYNLSREGVDRLITELDILMIQTSYGEGVSR